MSITTTPPQAKTVDGLAQSDLDLVRQSFGINDNPLKVDKTYIIFDAVVGNNNLHLDTGATGLYLIGKGNGTAVTSYSDTGGTKVLNYTKAGKYLITIEGVFHGIKVGIASQSDKDKYISIVAGSNYPTAIVGSAFVGCSNLENVFIPNVVSIGDNSFELCTELKAVILGDCTSIGVEAFKDSTKIKTFEINYDAGLTVGTDAFNGVILNNLIVNNSTLVQAKEVRTKMSAKGCLFSSEFKLYSNDIQVDTLSINERLLNKPTFKTAASGLPSSIGAGIIDMSRVNDYYSEAALTGAVTWGLSNILPDRVMSIDLKIGANVVNLVQAGVTFKGAVIGGVVQDLSDTESNLITIWAQTPIIMWVTIIVNRT